jgi:hypothetical protein
MHRPLPSGSSDDHGNYRMASRLTRALIDVICVTDSSLDRNLVPCRKVTLNTTHGATLQS